MRMNKLTFLLVAILSTSFFAQNNPWDGLTNYELSGNRRSDDGKGYYFNYGAIYPESGLSNEVANCLDDRRVHNVFNAPEGVTLSFDSLNYHDELPEGAASLKIEFDGQPQSEVSVNRYNTSFKFFTGNCNPIEATPLPLIQGENNKIRILCQNINSMLVRESENLKQFIKSCYKVNAYIIIYKEKDVR